MKSITVFISHSSDDKDLLHKVVELLGKNAIAIDEYVFESGERTEDEINLSIDNAGAFFLLLSETSIGKEWVKREIARIKNIIDQKGDEKFIPLIIDDRLDYLNTKIPKWIRDEYNLREKYTNAIFLARKISEEINKLKWNQYPSIKERDLTFDGRENDIAKLKETYYRSDIQKNRAVLVSGIPAGIGRRRLLTEFVKIIDKNKKDTYQPLSLDLDKDNSIEDFVLHLHSLLLSDTNESILSFLNSATQDDKISYAQKLLNTIYKHKDYLFIRDDGAIVRQNGSICDWFAKVLAGLECDRLFFLIASRNRLVFASDYPEVISYSLEPLTEKGALTLLYDYLRQNKKSVSEENAKLFIEKTAHLPMLILRCADSIVNLGESFALKRQINYEYKGDELVKSIVDEFKNSVPHLQMLILLSEVDYLTYQQIDKICKGIIDEDLIEDVLFDLYSLSIYEHFGSNNEFIHMNPIISDRIKRSRYKLNEDIWSNLQMRVNEIITTQDFNTADLGILTKKIEYEIRGDIRNINHSHIVPSIALKIILDEYGKKSKEGYRNVVLLCNKVLENRSCFFSDIVYRILYYLCASYAHLGDDNLFCNWHSLSDYEKLFLHGLYYRKRKDYPHAESKFREALKIRRDSYTAKNELAIALQRQGKYNDALKLAKDAYNAEPSNAYYIVTYYKSLVRDMSTKDEILHELIDKLHTSWDKNREAFASMLEAEYEYFRNNDFDTAIAKFRSALSLNSFYPVFISACEICEIERRHDVEKALAIEFNFE